MPVKVGGKGKMQEYDPKTGKFGRGGVDSDLGNGKKEEPKDDDAVVTIVWHGQKVIVKGALTKARPQVDEIKNVGMSFKEAVENNK